MITINYYLNNVVSEKNENEMKTMAKNFIINGGYEKMKELNEEIANKFHKKWLMVLKK